MGVKGLETSLSVAHALLFFGLEPQRHTMPSIHAQVEITHILTLLLRGLCAIKAPRKVTKLVPSRACLSEFRCSSFAMSCSDSSIDAITGAAASSLLLPMDQDPLKMNLEHSAGQMP